MALPRWLRPLAGLAVAAGLLAGAEGLLRLLDLPDPGLYDGDPATVWWLRPGLDREVPSPSGAAFRVQTNALGLRGEPPPAAGRWTLALGCSTTFGWGVEAAEAWPARLAALLGEPVVNGGVPGWSTHQARAAAGRWLELEPDRVILAYIVRDAQPAARPDAASRPTPPLLRARLLRLLAGLLPPPAAGELSTWRVPPDAYRDNLRALLAQAGAAEVVLLAFPQRSPGGQPAAAPWRAVLGELGPPVLAPELPADAFFPDDPVHLTAAGHAQLAAAIAPALAR